MTHYSIVPAEELFYAGWETAIHPLQEVTIGSVTMQVSALPDGRVRIERLISGNPYDYLNPAYMPGNTIRFEPKFE